MTLNLPEVREVSATRPLAGRPHRCTICGLPIAIGTRYARHTLYDRGALDRKKRLFVVCYHLPSCTPVRGDSNVG